eukprot:EG_transcript_33115
MSGEEDEEDTFFHYKGEKRIVQDFSFDKSGSDEDVEYQGISTTPTKRLVKRQKLSAFAEGSGTDDPSVIEEPMQFSDSVAVLNKSAALLQHLKESPEESLPGIVSCAEKVLTVEDVDSDSDPNVDCLSPKNLISLKVRGKDFREETFVVQADGIVDTLRSQVEVQSGRPGVALVLDGKVLQPHQR